MAYLSKEKTADIRSKIKAAFPAKDGWKFSIVNEHYTSLSVSIMAAPVRFTERNYEQLNHHYTDRYQNAEILNQIVAIAMEGNHDNSDSQTDYFDVGWYLHLEVGKYDKSFEYTGPVEPTPTPSDDLDIEEEIDQEKLAARPLAIVLVIIDPSGKKVSIPSENRQKYYENLEVMQSVKDKISDRIRAEFESECKDLKSENDRLYKDELAFRKQAKMILLNCTTETKLRVHTQVGKNGSIINKYDGHLERNFHDRDGTFNFVSEEYNNGNPFTIGFSCLQSIELLP